jgi:hypothetical protein
MADDPPPAALIRADALRLRAVEREMAKLAERDRAAAEEAARRAAFVEAFMHGHVDAEERAAIRRLVEAAAARGQTEALIFSFPSDLCTDGGRAINNQKPDWADTLQGKARELHDLCRTVAKPAGYRLLARIVSFPGGMPGDVGFFLDWAE